MSELPDFSFGRHAALVLGAATVMLGLTTVALWALSPDGPLGLVVVTVGLVLTFAVASVVSKQSLRRSFDEVGTDDAEADRSD
ncbi:hypothetical protein [Rhodococcus sp. MEB064]|uniref:hypothetical protein n=1 Tax=Rhodococcus sp. MEB064 TaxID=1587522 RepID=UPI00069863B9|nr:hypothetical protein [Rhodococcus sp. MEB064]